MTTFILLLVFAGFYTLYNTSSRAVLPQGPLELWLKDKSFLKPVGIMLLLLSLVLTAVFFGLAAGIFYWFVILSTVASLIIILSPLKIMSYKLVGIIFLGIMIAENLIV